MSKDLTELLAAIPLRDDSLRLALEEIERKLSAWSAAVAGLDLAPRTDIRSAAPSPVEQTPAETKAPTASIHENVIPATRTADSDATPEVAEPEQTDPAPAVTEDTTDYELTDRESQETPVARPANPDDDESVLVGLSPESAKAIKVQWRLLEGTKSLRQLVEEHKARLVRGESRDGKRSWWGRGKG